MDTEKQAPWKNGLYAAWTVVFLFALYASAKTISDFVHVGLAIGFLILVIYSIIFSVIISVLAGRIDGPRNEGAKKQIGLFFSYIPPALIVLITVVFMLYSTIKVAQINDWPFLKIVLSALGAGATIILAKVSSVRRARKEKQGSLK